MNSVISIFFQTQALFAGLLLAQVLCAADLEAPWTWNACGTVEPPKGYSVLKYTSRTVNMDSNGVIQCSCSGENNVDFTFSVVNEEQRIVAKVNATVYPCLTAACSTQVISEMKISNFTSVQILQEECNKIEFRKTSGTIEFFMQDFNESHTKYCHKPPKIILSQKHMLNTTEAVDMPLSTSGTLNIKNYITFDMDSCAEAVKQGHTATVVFHTVKKSSIFKHTLKKRENNPPSFLKNYYSVEVMENVILGTRVAVVQASDIDQGVDGELTYTMQPASNQMSADYFAINGSSGEITTTDTIDREMMSEHVFHVTATDGGGEYMTVTYTIQIVDENDNSPRYIMGNVHTIILYEDREEQSTVLSLEVVDDDEGTNSLITFTLENNTVNTFAINAALPLNQGAYMLDLKVVKQLDYEMLNFYRLTIIAQDGGNPSHSTAARVDVEVRDVLDNPPLFNSSEYIIEVLENTEIGTPVFTLNATSLDSPSITDISYYILSSPADYKFTVGLNTGVIAVHSEIDYEAGQRYTFSVRAQNGHTSNSNLQTIVNIVINVININDNSPDFIRSMYTADVVEGTQTSHFVLSVRAIDNDHGIYGAINYHIAGNDSNITRNFHLNTTTGDISTLSVLDYELQTIYSFTVIAEDRGTPPRSDQVTVTIHVVNENDRVPVFLSLTYNASIVENSGTGALVVQVEAKDDDSQLLEYYLISSELQNKFSIETWTGRILTRENLDREDRAFYTLEVFASDGQLRSDANALVYVTVEDMNDRPPLFTRNTYLVELSEMLLVNSMVVVVEAHDEDEGTNSDVTYVSDVPAAFSLNSTSGIISLAETLDFEKEDYFQFLVWASDGGTVPLSSSALVEVTILDENDNAPVFDPGSQSSSIPENADAFTPVLYLSATDADSGSNAELQYTIIADSNAIQAFSIDSLGVIKTRRPLDREEIPLYNLVVEVRDMGSVPLSSTTNVSIVITDLIDFPPRFNSISYRIEITTDTPASTPLITVRATTQDNVPPSSILYSLGGGVNRTLFRINQRSGVISAATHIRPALHAMQYSFYVNAQHYHLSAIATVVINIMKNSTIPRLKPLTMYVNIFYPLMAPSTTLGTVALDRPHKDRITFSFGSSSPDIHHYFDINSNTGTIAVTNAVRYGYYKLTVIASSSLGVASGTVHVYIHTLSNTTLDNSVIVRFKSGTEIYFVALIIENFASALTELIPCTREQVEIIGIEEDLNGSLLVAFAIRKRGLGSYIPQNVILDRLLANEESSLMEDIISYGSEVCTGEPCPNFQQCSPVVNVHRLSLERAYKILQSTERIYISHPFSSSYTCHCPSGFDLQGLCSVQTDHCAVSPCQFGATCHNLHDDYVCDCSPFTGGKNCSTVCPSSSCDPCMPDKCLHGSVCVESQDHASHSCVSCPWPAEYSGPNCELTSIHVMSNGYAAFPSLASVVKTSISFRFSTIYPNGTLLYTGRVTGSHDVLSVIIIQGQLRITFSLGDNEPVAMATLSERKLNDGVWHDVKIHLDGHLQRVMVVVSGCSSSPTHLAGITDTCVLQQKITRHEKSLDVNTFVYIGGIESHISHHSSVTGSHFEVCIADLVIDDRIIDLASPVRQHRTSKGCGPRDKNCHKETCHNGECIPVWNGVICHCEGSPDCSQSSNSVSLSNGYILLQGPVLSIDYFSLAFRTRQTHATLIELGDVSSVKLEDGLVVYRQNTSSLTTSLVLQTAVNDGLWHTISMTTEQGTTKLSVDLDCGSATHRDSETYSVTSIQLGSTDLTSFSRFEGCFADFSVNELKIDLAIAMNGTSNSTPHIVESLHTEVGCQLGSFCNNSQVKCPKHSTCENRWYDYSCVCKNGFVATEDGVCVDPCDPNPCQNNGLCIPGVPVQCQCSPGYHGTTCDLMENTPCPTGLYSPPDCQPCLCDLKGVLETVCDGSGRCLCNSSLNVFSPPNDTSCQLCDCDKTGAIDQQCLPSTGECPCLPGVTGRQCDRCQEGFAGMTADGCKEAVVVKGLYTLKGVVYHAEFDRRGSSKLTHLISELTEELKTAIARYAIVGEQETTITTITNSSGQAVVHYRISSYSRYDEHPLPTGHVHTVASVMQTVVRSGWVGLHPVDPMSHFLTTECSCDMDSRCVYTETSVQNPQLFVCDTCPDGLTLDGIICRKIVNETCVGDDIDRDGISDLCDNCPFVFNPSQRLDDCSLVDGICPTGHSSGVLWSQTPEETTTAVPCAHPLIGYARRQCLSGGVWGEVDTRDCVSARAQQFLFDAESLRAKQVMNVHQLLYSISEVASFVDAGFGVSGGDLSAAARYLSEVVRTQVESVHGLIGEQHHQLLEAISTSISRLLAPEYTSLWTPTSSQYTGFSLSLHLPQTLEMTSTLFQLYHSSGVSKPHMEIKTMFNLTSNFSGAVVYMNALNGSLSSIVFSSNLTKNLRPSQSLDIVVGSYPTIGPLLSPSPSNFTIASVILTVQIWGKGVTEDNLPAPVIITLAHSRKVYVYNRESTECVYWHGSGSIDGWSSDGCVVAGINASHTICSCRHLSLFAVLLPSSSLLPVEEYSDEADFHPTVFTFVALTVTCFLLLLTLLVLWIIRWSSGNMHITVYRNLVLNLLLTTVVFLIGIDRTEPPALCAAFSIALDFLIIASPFWMLVVGVVIARLLLHPPPKTASCVATFFVVAGLWTIPILMCIIPVGVVAMSTSSFVEEFGHQHYCMVAPKMAYVLLSPVAVLVILIIIVLVVALVLVLTQKQKSPRDGPPQLTLVGIAAIKSRARRQLGILASTLSLYLLTWSAGLLAIYGHVFPGSTRSIMEIVFAISYTVLGGFVFTVLCLNKKVINTIRAWFEPKYQNSSLQAIAGSSSLVSRLRAIGREQEISPPCKNMNMHHRRQQRIEARSNHQGRLEATNLDMVSMEAQPRTPNTEPLYHQIRPTSTQRPTVFPTRHPHPSRRNRTRQTRLLHSRAAPVPNTGATSSSGDADLDTDATASEGGQPWYQILESQEQTQSTQTDIDYPHVESDTESDNDSRADPSGVSMHDIEQEELQGNKEVRYEREGDCECGDGRRESNGSLHLQLQHTPVRPLMDEQEPRCNNRRKIRGLVEESEIELQNRIGSPQPSADPMWYRRASGCEETGDMPTQFNSCHKKLSSPQKSVKWADQELTALSPILHSPHNSDPSHCSSTVSRNYHTGRSRRCVPPLSLRFPPEGTGAVVSFPSPSHCLRKASSGSLPPPSPTSRHISFTSHLSSSSNQLSYGMSSTRGVAVDHSHRAPAQRPFSCDYHSHGPSVHSNRRDYRISHNPDGSKTLQSLV